MQRLIALWSILIGTLISITPSASAQSAKSGEQCANRLIGLWGAEVSFGPEIKGNLTISRKYRIMHVSIGGIEEDIRSDSQQIRFRLPGGRGEFRGRLVDRERRIQGQWIQPMTAHVWGTVYATPVELSLNSPGVWRGSVLPLEDSESIFFMIERDSTGTLNAFVRSPERNLGRYLGAMKVECEGDRVRFLRGPNGADTLSASYDQGQDILSVYLPTEGGTFDLTKRSRDNASGFYARTYGADSYRYRQPVQNRDGWQTASLADVGVDEKGVTGLIRNFIDTPVSNITSPYPQAFLVARHGKLVVEEYFFGFDRDRVHDVRSAGKTLTATLVGIAMRNGAAIRRDSKAVSFFPQYERLENDDADKQAITVEHLLTMKSGLDADDDKDSSPGNEDRLVGHKDRYKFALDLRMAYRPGKKAQYSAAGINLLGGIVQQSTGKWLPDVIYELFARPLGIKHYHVPLSDSGDAYMAGGMLMRPRDFLKLGQLFLSRGRWRGLQIVDPSFVQMATRAHGGIHEANDYGYGWWIRKVKVGEREYHTYRAAGNGGQMVIVIPDLDMVVLFMGGNYNQGPIWWRWNDELVPKILIPAAQSSRFGTR